MQRKRKMWHIPKKKNQAIETELEGNLDAGISR